MLRVDNPCKCFNPNHTSVKMARIWKYHMAYNIFVVQGQSWSQRAGLVNWLVTNRQKRKTDFHWNSILFPSLLSVSSLSSLSLPFTSVNCVLPVILTLTLSYHIFPDPSFSHFFSFNLHLHFCFSHFTIPSIHNAHSCSALHHRHLRSNISIL